jgi:hypothetical protein
MPSNNFTASGYVKIYGLYPNTAPRLMWEGSNALTQGFSEHIARLLGGAVGSLIGADNRTVESGTALWAAYMIPGKGSSAPQFSDTSLEDPFLDGNSDEVIVPISSVSYSNPLPGSVTFNAILPTGSVTDSFNQDPLQEIGLYSESGVLLARYVHSAQNKTPTFQLQYSWTITFRS